MSERITSAGYESLARGLGEVAWHPIETAPKDGTPIDVWLGDPDDDEDIDFYCTPGGRRAPGWYWRDDRFRPIGGLLGPALTCFASPTHWMPIPKGPGREADSVPEPSQPTEEAKEEE